MLNRLNKTNPKKSSRLRSAGSVLLLIAFAVTAQAGPPASQYEVRFIEGPLPGSDDFPFLELPSTIFWDINDHGIATWESWTLDSNSDYLFEAGLYDTQSHEFTTLGRYSDGDGSVSGVFPFAINNGGALTTGDDCGLVDKKGNFVQLVHPLYDVCSTRGVASNGLVAGYTIDGSGVWRGFVYDPKDDSFVDFLADPDRNIAQGINSGGQVVGGIGPQNDREGYVRNLDGTVRRFKVTIDGVRYPTQARGISAGGMIVGNFNSDSGSGGFVGRLPNDPLDEDLIPNAVFTPANTPECTHGIFISRINNRGTIVGLCRINGIPVSKGLLLTPIAKGKK